MAKTTGMDRRPANLGAGIYERLLRPDRDAEEANDHAWSGQIDQRVSALDITSPGSVLTERRKERNGWNLAPGVYGGFEHSASLNAITGVSHGAKINRHCTFNNQSTVVGVEFTDEGDPSMRELVRVVSPDGERPNCVVFINCRFTRGEVRMPAVLSSQTFHVTVESAAYATFIGCVFVGTTNNGTGIIKSPGVAYTYVLGCVNLTMDQYGDVKNLGSVTIAPV